jgi:hypothetical protein
MVVGFPFDMVEKDRKQFEVGKEIYSIFGDNCVNNQEYNKEVERVSQNLKYDRREVTGRQKVLYATLNWEDIKDKTNWDSECGYYTYLLFCEVNLPFYGDDWEREIKWMRLKSSKCASPFMLNDYEEVERPVFYERICGFAL